VPLQLLTSSHRTPSSRRHCRTDTQNIIYLTFNVPNIQGEPNLDITEDQISFSATSGK
jgi:hypothetical protein